MLSGQFLELKPGKLVVQTWRGTHWKKGDQDSVLVLNFSDSTKGGECQKANEFLCEEHDDEIFLIE